MKLELIKAGFAKLIGFVVFHVGPPLRHVMDGVLGLQEAVYGASGVPVEKIGALDRFKKRKLAD